MLIPCEATLGSGANDLNRHLWEQHKILVTGTTHEDFTGQRVSPSVYFATEEVDRFAEVIEEVARNDLPA